MPAIIALVGDYSPGVIAHRAIPAALELARSAFRTDLAWEWVKTRDVSGAAPELGRFHGIWLVPASPYENTAGALAAVRFARESQRPFLGTCGGFQHALIEFARNVAELPGAEHTETSPHASTLVVTPLSCSLVEKSGQLHLAAGSILRAAYGADTAHEGYHCNYGFNAAHRATLEAAGLNFTAFDETGEIRAAELPLATHPFFVGTLFQPERSALRGELPPIVRAFVHATVTSSS